MPAKAGTRASSLRIHVASEFQKKSRADWKHGYRHNARMTAGTDANGSDKMKN